MPFTSKGEMEVRRGNRAKKLEAKQSKIRPIECRHQFEVELAHGSTLRNYDDSLVGSFDRKLGIIRCQCRFRVIEPLSKLLTQCL